MATIISVVSPPTVSSIKSVEPVFDSDKVNELFGILNRHLFQSALNGVELMWLNSLKSRTSLSVKFDINNNDQTSICLSRRLLAKCTRKQLIESLLYEMVFIYIWSKLSKPNASDQSFDDNDKAKALQAMLKRAMDFLNHVYGTTLSFNYSSHAHRTTQKFDEWIGVDADIDHHQFNDSIICISDSDSDDEDDLKLVRDIGYEPITNKLQLQPVADRQWTINRSEKSICLCCTDYDKLFTEYFAGTNFKLNDISDCNSTKCPLCYMAIERDSLNVHFDKTCPRFVD